MGRLNKLLGREAPTVKVVKVVKTKAAAKTKADITACAYDNEHADGVFCTLTFADGSQSTGTAPSTGDLAHDQAEASAKAMNFAT